MFYNDLSLILFFCVEVIPGVLYFPFSSDIDKKKNTAKFEIKRESLS